MTSRVTGGSPCGWLRAAGIVSVSDLSGLDRLSGTERVGLLVAGEEGRRRGGRQ